MRPLLNLPRSRAEARNLGLDRFFTGVPCDHGHVAARYVSTTNCVPCQVEHGRRNGGWKARPSREDFLRLARERVEANGGVLLSTDYASAKSKLKVQCKRGHVFEISADNLRGGKWCRECKGINESERHAANRRTVEEMREFARREHGGDCLAKEPALSTDKVEWMCKNGHKFMGAVCKVMTAIRLSASGETRKGTWCPGCNLERLSVNPARAPIPLQVFDDYVKARGGEIVRVLDGQFKGRKSRLKVRCENGHKWDVTGDQLLQKESWCPHCRFKNEQIVRAILEESYKTEFPKLRVDWLKSPKGKKLELDCYSERLKLAVEVQGPHHYHDENVRKTDRLKLDLCAKHGVQLIQVDAVKQPFPPKNVHEKVKEAFQQACIQQDLVLPPIERMFRKELEVLRQIAKERGLELVPTEFLGRDAQYDWWCGDPDHRPWRAEPWRIKRGAGCPSCAGNRRLDIEELSAWGDQIGIKLIDKEYLGSTINHNWRCKTDGHEFSRSKGNMQQSLDQGYSPCPQCSDGRGVSGLVRKNRADEFAMLVLPIIVELRAAGFRSLDAIAQQLNERRIPTARGTTWHASTVKNVFDRVARLRRGR
jgi:hypothetical protein